MNGRAVQERAPAPLGHEQLLAAWIVRLRHHALAVDLQRQRRAEDRQSVRVIVVPSIGSKTQQSDAPLVSLMPLAELFGQDGVVREPLGNQRAEHPLDRHVGVGDQVDGAFLGDREAACRGTPSESGRPRVTASMAVARNEPDSGRFSIRTSGAASRGAGTSRRP